MLLLPLLLFFALLSLSGGAEVFDSNRCKDEMMCFIPGTCTTGGKTALIAWTGVQDIEKCPAVIAIRPYSEKKWLVAMRGKGINPNGLQLSIGTSNRLKFDCKPDTTGNATINVDPTTSKDRVFTTDWNPTGNYILCEFETISGQEILAGSRDQSIVLSFSTANAPTEWKIAFGAISYDMETAMKAGCNPDDITFENEPSDAELRLEVDSRRFEVMCPKDSQLTYSKDATAAGYAGIAGLRCVADATNGGRYQVITAGGATPVPIAKGTKIPARCAQNRCALCPEVPPQSGLDKANFTVGSGAACAKLTCPGNRFAIGEHKERLVGQQQPVCRDGQWSIGGKQFEVASCYVEYDCAKLKCARCSNVTATSVNCSGKLTLTHDGRSSKINVTGLHCDRATGKWRAKAADGQDHEVDPTAATISCARKAPPKQVARGAVTVTVVVASIGTLVCGSLFILTMIVGYRMYVRVPIEEHTSDESKLEEGGSAEQHHGDGRHHNDDVSSGGVTGSTTSQQSGGSIKAPEPSVHTGIPTRPEPPAPAPPSSTPASAPAASATGGGPQPGSDPPLRDNNQGGAATSAEMLDDDHGYVIIDPVEHEKEVKRQEALKAAAAARAATAAAAAAAKAATGEGAKTEKVGVLPAPAAAAAAAAAAATPAATPAAAAAEQQQQTPPAAPTETTPPEVSPPQPEAKTQ